jgi:hypothetical protein
VTLSVTWSPVEYFDVNRMSEGGGGGSGLSGAGLAVAGGAGFFVVGAGLRPAWANAKVDETTSATSVTVAVLRI